MSFSDLEKRIQQVDVRHGTTSPPQRPAIRLRLLGCLILLTTALVGVSIGHSAFCDRLAFSSVLRQGAPDQDERFGGRTASDIVAADWLGNRPGRQGLEAKSPTAKRQATTISSAPTAAPTVLECFQVAQPVLTPHGAIYSPSVSEEEGPSSKESCTVLLMEHTFAWSYNDPFIGNYTPPSCQFNRVVMNFTVTSQGRQFDRLALMYFGDTEVWRTSTAEPTSPPGIRWVYLKDMTHYLYFWKSPQKLIFDLGNLVDDKYTGSFNTTLTATFFTSDVESGAAPPSDLVIPISKRQGAANAVSQFTLPEDEATNTVAGFPRNARRAVFSVSACGQASEEFWWSNVLQSDVYAFNATAGEYPGLSPFREVQVLIDGQVAGVQWPFPVIFTGGVVPGLHRPVVGLDAFDLREHEIDITPFLPLLCDGAEHTFTIRIAGLDDDGGGGGGGDSDDFSDVVVTETVGDSWYVTGKIFVWLDDDEGSITTGDAPTVEVGPPVITLSRHLGQTSNGTNETLAYTTEVRRTLTTSGRVVTQRSSGAVSWSQKLSYSNKAYISSFGYDQLNELLVEGADRSSSSSSSSATDDGDDGAADVVPYYGADYRYPLFANTTTDVSEQGNLTLRAHLVQGLRLRVRGASVFPTGLEAFGGGGDSTLETSKEGTASFFQTGDGKNSSGFGDSAQVFRFSSGVGGDGDGDDVGDVSYDRSGGDGGGGGVELFFRHVSAVNGTVVYDRVRIEGRDAGGDVEGGTPGEAGPAMLFAPAPAGGGRGPRVFMGRAAVGVE